MFGFGYGLGGFVGALLAGTTYGDIYFYIVLFLLNACLYLALVFR